MIAAGRGWPWPCLHLLACMALFPVVRASSPSPLHDGHSRSVALSGSRGGGDGGRAAWAVAEALRRNASHPIRPTDGQARSQRQPKSPPASGDAAQPVPTTRTPENPGATFAVEGPENAAA
jgi:hypothetical protein